MEYLPRLLERKVDEKIMREEFIILKGPRQSGKTTLIQHLAEKYGATYYTFEDPKILELFDKDPLKFVEVVKSKLIFLDEAQYCKNVGRHLKFIYDILKGRIKIVVTGSGSFDIKVLVGSYLVGRCTYFELLPLTFEEFLLWKDEMLYRIFKEKKNALLDFILRGRLKKVKVILKEEFLKALEEFLVFGGFPKVVKEVDKRDVLRDISLTYLEKDVGFFLNVFHLEKFRNLLKYLSIKNGSYLEISNISKELGISFQTIQDYTSILVNTYVAQLLLPFHRNLATEIKKRRKIYFVDLGMRNFLIDDFRSLDKRADKGILYENFILNEMRELGEMKYWRTKDGKEMDFILRVGQELVPIEVKSRPEITGSLLDFIENYRIKRAVVFNEREFKVETVDGATVIFSPLFYV